MQTEYEATFTGVDKDDARRRIAAVGGTLVRPEFLQKRVNFTLPTDSPVRHGWLRVRDEGDRVTLSLKSVEQSNTIDGQKETMLVVDSFAVAAELLASLGCQRKAYQESRREIWHLAAGEATVEVCIDEWPWLPPFVEVEGPTEAVVRAACSALGYDYGAALFGAVDLQYMARYGVAQDTVNLTPRIAFGDPCPFDDVANA